MPNFTPHSSIVPFFADAAEPGIPEFDANRIMAYAQYEQFYWNHPESFRLVQRGEDEAPIYLPSARRIIEATNRFLAVGFADGDSSAAMRSGTLRRTTRSRRARASRSTMSTPSVTFRLSMPTTPPEWSGVILSRLLRIHATRPSK
jgi:hypothetical protein